MRASKSPGGNSDNRAAFAQNVVSQTESRLKHFQIVGNDGGLRKRRIRVFRIRIKLRFVTKSGVDCQLFGNFNFVLREQREFVLRAAIDQIFRVIGDRKRLPKTARSSGDKIFQSGGDCNSADRTAFKVKTRLRVRFALLANAVDIRVKTEPKIIFARFVTQIIGKLKARRVEKSGTRTVAAERSESGDNGLPVG